MARRFRWPGAFDGPGGPERRALGPWLRNDLSAAQSALAEARALAATLGWLGLEQRINVEIRRLTPSEG